MLLLKLFYLIINLCIFPKFNTTKLPLSTTIASINAKSNIKNVSSKSVCCSCNDTTKISVNRSNLVPKSKKIIVRLKESIFPKEYNLSLKFDFKSFQKDRFEEALGNVSIVIKVKKESNFILLHCDDNIIITSVSVRQFGIVEKVKELVKAFKQSSVLNITLLSPIKENNLYVIDIFNYTFRYFLNHDSGILTRTFENTNGTTDFILATQFEPEAARKIFPCFDEPKFKSVFNIKITTNSEFNIISNSPEIRCEESLNWKTCSFEPSPIMSTYNLAFSINNFDYIQKVDFKNVTYRIWARPSLINNSLIALDFTVELFDIFERMFKLNFPLRKVDSLAIPNLRGFLGMEHFGLITYDESIIIQDKRFPMSFSRQLCALIISHEVSHQWFGNIVTTAWWQDLWLNEGFATYYSFRLAAKILKNNFYNSLEKLTIINYVKHMDEYYSLPRGTMNFPVITRAESKFDYLSYKKGFIIINMIEDMINVTLFDLSMVHYLNKFKYNSVYPKDLWKAISMYSDYDFEKIMENWIGKFCYPIVKVNVLKDSTVVLNQSSSFSLNLNNISKNLHKYITNVWSLPLFVTYGNSTFTSKKQITIFKNSNGTMKIANFNSSNHWILINSNYISLFTSDYNNTILDRLTETLLKNHNIIPPLSRAHILQDVYDSSKKYQKKNFKRIFKLLLYIKNETHPIPLITAINLIDKFNGLFQFRTFYLSWYKYIKKILKPSFLKLVSDIESQYQKPNPTDITLRIPLFNIACKLKFSYCRIITDSIVERWNSNSLFESDYDLLHIALCQYIQNDELGERWIRLYSSKMFQSWDFLNVKYYAMGCSKVPWVIEKNIDIALNVLQYSHDRENSPHVTWINIDQVPSDRLQGVTSLTNVLLLSSIYNYPNFQSILIRFTKNGLNILCNSIIYEPYFPIPKSIIEYAIPTISHYKFMKEIFRYESNAKDAVLADAKSNIDWIKNIKRFETYIKEFSY